MLMDGIALLLKELEQLSDVCSGVIVVNTAAEHIPEVFDGCQIGGTAGSSE
jgi:hypothetical protein